jgi:ABC-type branched-subunit amino acid transport system substrate-binding protein
MKKFALLMILILIFSGCGEEKSKEEIKTKKTIKIGAILPLTGNASEPGIAAKKSLELMLDKLKKQNLKYDYQLIFEDNQMLPLRTVTATNKLFNIDKVSAIFSIWNMAGNVIAEFTKEKNVFGFSCSYGEKSTIGKYNYNFISDLNIVAETLSKELLKRKITKVALFTSNAHVELTEAIEKSFVKNNITLTFNEMANWGGKDFRSSITKAQKTSPEQYIILDVTPSPYIFMKQLKEITQKNDNVTTIDTFGEMTFDTRPIADGLWFIETTYKEPSDFTRDLLKVKKVKANGCSSQIAASLEIYINAIENSKVLEDSYFPTNDDINKWIWDNITNYSTVAGKTTIIKKGLFHTKPQVKMIKNSEIVDFYK